MEAAPHTVAHFSVSVDAHSGARSPAASTSSGVSPGSASSTTGGSEAGGAAGAGTAQSPIATGEDRAESKDEVGAVQEDGVQERDFKVLTRAGISRIYWECLGT